MFKFITNLVVFSILMIFARVSFAADFNWTTAFKVTDNITYSYKSGNPTAMPSAGIHYGNLWNITNKDGTVIVEMGGINFNVNPEGRLIIAPTLLSVFDNTVHFSVGIDSANYRWDNPDDYMFGISISATGLLEKLGQ